MYYSPYDDKELWTATDLDEAVTEYLEDSRGQKVGDIIEVYSGECMYATPSSLLGVSVIDDIVDSAWENYDSLFNWDTKVLEHKDLFDSDLNIFLDKWFRDHNLSPDFGRIHKIKSIKVKITEVGEDEDPTNWEIVNDI